jgi:hypothetical protein
MVPNIGVSYAYVTEASNLRARRKMSLGRLNFRVIRIPCIRRRNKDRGELRLKRTLESGLCSTENNQGSTCYCDSKIPLKGSQNGCSTFPRNLMFVEPHR